MNHKKGGLKGSLAFLQNSKFVNRGIRGFVFLCHEQVNGPNSNFIFFSFLVFILPLFLYSNGPLREQDIPME